jgi:LTXXQ motif family protein
MKGTLLGALTAVALSVSPFALTVAVAAGDQSAETTRAERMKHWVADHQATMDARLSGMKEALKPTAQQYPFWEAFEDAVRNADKARVDDTHEMMENRERMSPVERLDAMAGLKARRAAELKTIAEAAKPLYGSLDDAQKRTFGLLSHEMLMSARGPMWEELGGDAGGTWVPAHWD